MPTNPPKPCAEPGCPKVTYSKYCSKHTHHKFIGRPKRKSSTQRGYTSRWTKEAKAYLIRNPLCVPCMGDRRVTQATVVDHITPHKGDMKLFWDVSNWQSSCKTCHDKKTATEDGGFGNKGVVYDYPHRRKGGTNESAESRH